jgi:hypothetical protein
MAEIFEKGQKSGENAPKVQLNPNKQYKINVNPNSLANLKPAVKGQAAPKGAGRPKGVGNLKNEQWSVLHEHITGKHTERFNEILGSLAMTEPEKFLDTYLRILEYFKPRLQRAENINANVELDKVVLNLNGDMAIDLPSNFDESETDRGGVGDFVNAELLNEEENNAEKQPE